MTMSKQSTSEEESQPLLTPQPNGDVPVHKGYGARHTFCILVFFAYFNIYTLRFNMSVAIVAMTNVTTSQANVTASQECPDNFINSSKTKSQKSSEFDWDEAEQGFILSAFFYGYIITQIPGGILAESVGGKKLAGFAVLLTAILTLFIPLLANVGIWALVLVRAIQGLAEGVTFPAIFALQGKWTPAQEKTVLPAITLAGASLGNVICLPLCGYLSSINLFGGWPANFYVFGIAACVWWLLWQFLVHDSPAEHPRISSKERAYIEATAGSTQKVSTPWGSILTSKAVWSLSICRLMMGWGASVLAISIPSYMSRIQKFDITEDGLLTALPNLSGLVVSVFAGWLSDFILKKNVMSVTCLRKSFTTIGILISAICYSAIPFVGCNHYMVVILLSASGGILGFGTCSMASNILDIGNNFAGPLMGLTNFIGNLAPVASPYIVGLITNHNDTMQQWRIVFFICSGMNIFGAVTFLLFGKGTAEKWNTPTESSFNKTIDIQYNNQITASDDKEKWET